MAEPEAVVTITETGREPVDSEIHVRSLRDLYDACRDAPPSKVVRVSLRGTEGEVLLNFASFVHRSATPQ